MVIKMMKRKFRFAPRTVNHFVVYYAISFTVFTMLADGDPQGLEIRQTFPMALFFSAVFTFVESKVESKFPGLKVEP